MVVRVLTIMECGSMLPGVVELLGIECFIGSVSAVVWDFYFLPVPELSCLGSLDLAVPMVLEGPGHSAMERAGVVGTVTVCSFGERHFLAEAHTGGVVARFFKVFLVDCFLD